MKKKTLSALEGALVTAQKSAQGGTNSTVSNERASLMRSYNREKYGNEVADRSQYVSSDTRDIIEATKAEIMDIFFGGDKTVEYTPRGEEDVQAAEQETEAVNYIIQQENNGFKVFLDWFHDALAYKNGYVKRYWHTHKTTETEEYVDVDEREIAAIAESLADDNSITEVEPLESDEGTAKFRVCREANKYRIESVPPEEVIVDSQWTELHLNGCPFFAHKTRPTVSDLIAQGFDKAQVEALPEYNAHDDSPEANEREENTDTGIANETGNSQSKIVLVYENYIQYDSDGDGITELLQVYTDVNGTILKRDGKPAVEQVETPPINCLSPFPIPHVHYGSALAEFVEDLQKVDTQLTRQLLDNLAMHNNPDTVVDTTFMTPELAADLGQTNIGRVLRARGGLAAVSYMQAPDTSMTSLSALQHFDSIKEKRTGVTAYNQGLDADSLNKTATGITKIMTQSQKRLLMIARVFAETGVKQLFLDIHKDLRRGPVKDLVMKLRNEWVTVNPRTWKERNDMTVSVGLGSGDREVQFGRLSMILNHQKEAMMADPTGQVSGVGPKNIHHTLTKMLEISGIKDVEQFFPEPPETPPAPPEPQPDPAETLAQVEMQKAQVQAESRMAEAKMKDELERDKMAQQERIAAADRKSQQEMTLAKLILDAKVAGEKMDAEEEKEVLKAVQNARQNAPA